MSANKNVSASSVGSHSTSPQVFAIPTVSKMVGSVASSSSSSSARGNHSVDRFYNPPQRRQLQLQQKQQQEQEKQQKHHQITKPIRQRPKRIPPKVEVREVENPIEPSQDSPAKHPTTSSYPCSSFPLLPLPFVANLDRFIHFTTPTVLSRSLYKTVSRDWMNPDALESLSYFSLGDLWESFRKWSAYGAEVPLVLDGSQDIVQYYVPYLSGIQLYVNSNPKPRHLGEHGDGKLYRDLNNGDSAADVCGSDLGVDEKWSKVALFCNTHADIHARDTDEIQNSHLVFEYFENCPPHLREPLADKVSVLASKFPQLKTFTSCDLLPSSWISIAWYPIYRIPACLSMQDLDTSFLTFHSLAFPSKCTLNSLPDPGCYVRNRNETKDISTQLSLPLFGLASYKFRSSIWNPDGLSKQDPQSLLQAADEWLRLLQVEHPDFNFFSEKHRNIYKR